jgi:hypothetical protein
MWMAASRASTNAHVGPIASTAMRASTMPRAANAAMPSAVRGNFASYSRSPDALSAQA